MQREKGEGGWYRVANVLSLRSLSLVCCQWETKLKGPYIQRTTIATQLQSVSFQPCVLKAINISDMLCAMWEVYIERRTPTGFLSAVPREQPADLHAGAQQCRLGVPSAWICGPGCQHLPHHLPRGEPHVEFLPLAQIQTCSCLLPLLVSSATATFLTTLYSAPVSERSFIPWGM